MGHLKNSVTLELVHQNVNRGESSYFLLLNGSCLEAEAHRLGDGGLLLSLNGSSYSTYSCIEATGYRVIIDNQTCNAGEGARPHRAHKEPVAGQAAALHSARLWSRDYRAASTPRSKDDGTMVMELRGASESGCVPTPEAAGRAGGRRLELDDPSRVRQASCTAGDSRPAWPARSRTPACGSTRLWSEFVQQLKSALAGLTSFPSRTFSEWMVQQVSGRIPTLLEQRIREQMAKYASNITSCIAELLEQFKKSRATVANYVVLAQPGGLQETAWSSVLLRNSCSPTRPAGRSQGGALIRPDLTHLRRADNASVTPTPTSCRHNQVESFFLSYISSATQLPGGTHPGRDFDIRPHPGLSSFITTPLVRIAACEVYIRRAYIAYDLTCVQQLRAEVLQQAQDARLDANRAGSHHRFIEQPSTTATSRSPTLRRCRMARRVRLRPGRNCSGQPATGARRPRAPGTPMADGGHMKRIGSAHQPAGLSQPPAPTGENLALPGCVFCSRCRRLPCGGWAR
uniref:ACC_central domain-containing protein n=1 Tax=Macrostomum lignano TaxID=282301 RepID=A0A1I8F6A9_9PLAT